MFQSTPSRRGRPQPASSLVVIYMFQSTPSRRGRHRMSLTYLYQFTFQSTPSRRGRLSYVSIFSRFIPVSIHSLTQRETQAAAIPLRQYSMFQSTPSRRGRLCGQETHGGIPMFQSTPSRRGRLNSIMLSSSYFVSIHSLTQRETHIITCVHSSA